MRTVTKRELNQQTAQVLAHVDAGESVVVTERGVARWRIEAIEHESDVVARLRARGKIVSPKARPQPWPAEDPHDDPARVDQLFADSRGDR
jgi:antitoxin (DNA-binding transcriptional repressor) of toxin-antitoxin stability system